MIFRAIRGYQGVLLRFIEHPLDHSIRHSSRSGRAARLHRAWPDIRYL